MKASAELPQTAKKNIEIIAQVEQELIRNRTLLERVGDRIAQFFGSLFFIAAHLVVLTGWFLVNTGRVSNFRPFDPYPFAFLALVVGIEFIFLTTFVLINQNHQMRRSERWWHLHLQLSMLTEQEVTKNMQMLVSISRQLGLQNLSGDKEVSEMTQTTSVTAVVGEIEKAREGGESATVVKGNASDRQ